MDSDWAKCLVVVPFLYLRFTSGLPPHCGNLEAWSLSKLTAPDREELVSSSLWVRQHLANGQQTSDCSAEVSVSSAARTLRRYMYTLNIYTHTHRGVPTAPRELKQLNEDITSAVRLIPLWEEQQRDGQTALIGFCQKVS